MGRTDYDSSGQVFTESVLPAKPSQANWASKATGNALEHTRFCSVGPGCSSLLNHSIRAFLVSSSTVTSSTLDGVPWHLACRIWHSCKKNQLDSVRLWQAFTTAYPDAPSQSGLKQRVGMIHHPQDIPLELYTQSLLSKTGDWLTSLTLQDISGTRVALVHGIARLTNLIVLSLGDGIVVDSGIGIDDGILRAWGRHAEADPERKVFGTLRVLDLRKQPSITAQCFEYLKPLPRLSVLNLESCGVTTAKDESIGSLAWTFLGVQSRSNALFADDSQSSDYLLSWNALAHDALAFAASRKMSAKATKELSVIIESPRLHLILGSDTRRSNLGGYFNVTDGMATYVKTEGLEEIEHSQRGSAGKRPSQDDESQNSEHRRKRAMRTSRQQDLGNVFFEFTST